MKFATFVLWSALLASAAPAFAQEPPLILWPQSQQRFDELAKWLREYHAWEDWFAVWGNRIARNFNNNFILERKKRPEPPVWLEEECREPLETDGLLASACDILRHWDAEPMGILQRRRSSLVSSGGTVDDKVIKSSFFQRVHLTGLWTPARFPATPVYGIVGMQVSVLEVGRYTLPALGVMMVTVPDGDGGHDVKPATTVGFGYRICDFVTPLIKRQAALHFNVARTIVHGAQDERILPGTLNFTLFGLSVSAKRHR